MTDSNSNISISDNELEQILGGSSSTDALSKKLGKKDLQRVLELIRQQGSDAAYEWVYNKLLSEGKDPSPANLIPHSKSMPPR